MTRPDPLPSNVTPIQGEALRYRVLSDSDPTLPYTVDLSENWGNGECRCVDFITKRNIAIKDGKKLFTRATTCKHIRDARRYYDIATLTDISEMLHPEQP